MAEQDTTTNHEDSQDDRIYYTITIVGGDSAQAVGRKLYNAGAISNLEEFHQYVKEHGYATKIRAGEFQIPEGASYEEICNIILKRVN